MTSVWDSVLPTASVAAGSSVLGAVTAVASTSASASGVRVVGGASRQVGLGTPRYESDMAAGMPRTGGGLGGVSTKEVVCRKVGILCLCGCRTACEVAIAHKNNIRGRAADYEDKYGPDESRPGVTPTKYRLGATP